ncbi:sugar phosphate isomerase/epimerase family protein [Paenibacillus radicis (ex Xue et al. 2023)]|uniref:Sugar phosphate isomerase/epimerase n=1 Tax=Paenibacillus radicis (ex Xue et al. 2023) TaxID=2972489 RepID=A0ABT1YP02_9BACL|nr:sugar phosphate isomerase/epimerase [Paenibacillus radicis (ex Xue et al. 2023)]MCR8634912.1 sugar phosphate isomerase/epimerase [Paenibacillus radicis (ex Xue et al. 2023)]
MRRMGVGLQLYTLRDDMAQDFRGTLRKVAELGYEGVEFAGYGGLEAEELRDLLKELNLKAIGAHVSLKNMRENLEKEIAYLKTIGAPYFICPHIALEDRKDAEAWKALFAFFEHAGHQIKEAGLQFGYHNHAFEFEESIDDEFVFDALYSTTSADIVKVEMDVCWVKYAGQDPLAYINTYAGRLPLLHLKDFNRGAENQMDTVELGLGEVDLPNVIQASSDAGVEWLIVEQDRCANPPLQSVATSLNWVKENYMSKL